MKARYSILLATLIAATSTAFAGNASLEAQLAAATSMDIVSVEAPKMPIQLINAGITTGEVKAIIEVSPDGSVSDLFITASSHEALAQAAQQAFRNWKFAPTDGSNAQVIQQISLRLLFRGSGYVVSANGDLSTANRVPGSPYAHKPTPVTELDQPLKAESTVAPAYPASLKDEGIGGSVIISYYIDEDGTVHVPTPKNSADPRLAAAAMYAVKQWKFTPPTVNGKPVFVKVQQTFRFNDEASPATAHAAL